MSQAFHIVPASNKTLWFLIPVGLALLLLFAYILYSSKHVQFFVSTEGIRITGDLYGRTIPATALIAAAAKPVNVARGSEFQPVLRTNGVGLPGYKSGWFRLRNGEKALLFVTSPSNVVYVPTRDGYALLLSASDPQALIESLQKIAP